MKEKNLLNRILQNTACPTGFWGRIILRGMNRFHAPLAEWAVEMVEWEPAWSVLDVGWRRSKFNPLAETLSQRNGAWNRHLKGECCVCQ